MPEKLIDSVETFRYKSRKRLYDTLRDNHMEGVVFLSGDVHMTQVYRNRCPSMTGQSNLLEFSSSGLSHSQYDSLPWAEYNMKLVGPEFYQETDPIVDLNFGLIEVGFSEDQELELGITIKDIEGKPIH